MCLENGLLVNSEPYDHFTKNLIGKLKYVISLYNALQNRVLRTRRRQWGLHASYSDGRLNLTHRKPLCRGMRVETKDLLSWSYTQMS